jgi:hypothetical protein
MEMLRCRDVMYLGHIIWGQNVRGGNIQGHNVWERIIQLPGEC